MPRTGAGYVPLKQPKYFGGAKTLIFLSAVLYITHIPFFSICRTGFQLAKVYIFKYGQAKHDLMMFSTLPAA